MWNFKWDSLNLCQPTDKDFDSVKSKLLISFDLITVNDTIRWKRERERKIYRKHILIKQQNQFWLDSLNITIFTVCSYVELFEQVCVAIAAAMLIVGCPFFFYTILTKL